MSNHHNTNHHTICPLLFQRASPQLNHLHQYLHHQKYAFNQLTIRKQNINQHQPLQKDTNNTRHHEPKPIHPHHTQTQNTPTISCHQNYPKQTNTNGPHPTISNINFKKIKHQKNPLYQQTKQSNNL